MILSVKSSKIYSKRNFSQYKNKNLEENRELFFIFAQSQNEDVEIENSGNKINKEFKERLTK